LLKVFTAPALGHEAPALGFTAEVDGRKAPSKITETSTTAWFRYFTNKRLIPP